MNKPKDYEPFQHMHDCGGGTMLGNWEHTVFCSDGRSVTGIGSTREQCMSAAAGLRFEREMFLAQPAKVKLAQMAAKHKQGGYLNSTEVSDMVLLISEILLQDNP